MGYATKANPIAPITDHGGLTGLTDDDHTQYMKEKASGGTAAEVPEHTHASAAEAGTVAHSATTGKTANDHHTEDHDHDGSPTQKLTQANTHESPDTDTGASSLHHTVGSGANQAAAGNHTHSASPITVQEEDSDKVTNLVTLDFDGSDFNVTDEGSGEARVGLAYGTGSGTPAEGNHTHAGSSSGGSFVFGDGSDGAITLDTGGTTPHAVIGATRSSTTWTLVRDIYCTDLTIDNSVTVLPSGWRIYCTGTLTNNGTISAQGDPGGAGTTSAGAAGASSLPAAVTTIGPTAAGGTTWNKGGVGGDNAAGSQATPTGSGGVGPRLGGLGGLGGTAVTTPTTTRAPGIAASGFTTWAAKYGHLRNLWQALSNLVSGQDLGFNIVTMNFFPGTGGSGGGGGNTNTCGGAGGTGGGRIFIFAKTCTNNGSITANGGEGGDGGGNLTASSAAGGGGGGGGIVVCISDDYSGNAATVAGGDYGDYANFGAALPSAPSTIQSTADATSYTHTGQTPVASEEHIIFVVNTKASSPDAVNSITGTGGWNVTWTLVDTVVNSAGTVRLSAFRGTTSASGAGNVIVDFGAGTQTGCAIAAIGLVNSAAEASMVLQTKAGTDDAISTVRPSTWDGGETIATLTRSSTVLFAAAQDAAVNATPDASFMELSDGTYSTPGTGLHVQGGRNVTDPITTAASGTPNWAAIYIEIGALSSALPTVGASGLSVLIEP